MKIICIAQWLYDTNFEILHWSDECARRHKPFKSENTFEQTRVDFFYREKYDVISQLRHSYAKGPFCVARLNSFLRGSQVSLPLPNFINMKF